MFLDLGLEVRCSSCTVVSPPPCHLRLLQLLHRGVAARARANRLTCGGLHQVPVVTFRQQVGSRGLGEMEEEESQGDGGGDSQERQDQMTSLRS